jgi:hypothetical protein
MPIRYAACYSKSIRSDLIRSLGTYFGLSGVVAGLTALLLAASSPQNLSAEWIGLFILQTLLACFLFFAAIDVFRTITLSPRVSPRRRRNAGILMGAVSLLYVPVSAYGGVIGLIFYSGAGLAGSVWLLRR